VVGQGCQFVISSHFPSPTAFPEAVIFRLDEARIEKVAYHQTEPYR